MKNSPEVIGAYIRGFREEYGISQSELARQLSVPRSTVWRWETGKGLPSYWKIVQLEDYMDDIKSAKRD